MIALAAYHFGGHSARGALVTMLFGLIGVMWMMDYVSGDAVQFMYEMNNVTVISSRVPQIIQNFTSGGTGTLSGVTLLLLSGGGCARILTTIQEGGGASMIRAYALGAALNIIMLIQVVYYNFIRKGDDKSKEDAKKKK